MTLPQHFSEWEHLQSQVRKLHNQRVREWFEEEPEEDISTPRSSLKHASLIKDKDSALICLVRMWFFEVTIGNAKQMQAPLYGLPISQFQEEFEVEYRPQIKLFFAQDANAVPEGYHRIESELSFRLMNETTNTYTKAKATLMAQLIKAKFSNYTFNKGKFKVTYVEPSKGYRLNINALSNDEGISVIRDILELQGHTINSKILTVTDKPKRQTENTPNPITILGKQHKGRRWRPTGQVKFRYALCALAGLNRDLVLVDNTNAFPNSFI